jgi:hypothetical protein
MPKPIKKQIIETRLSTKIKRAIEGIAKNDEKISLRSIKRRENLA